MGYTRVEEYRELKDGDQIAVLGLLKDMHPTLSVLYKLVSEKPFYFHHGIYMGGFTVVDFYGETKSDAKPREVDLRVFDNGIDRLFFRVDYEESETFPPDETIRMARDLITEEWAPFDILWNNCETMGTYLKTGKKLSQQGNAAALRFSNFFAAAGAVVAGGSSIAAASKPKST